MRFPSAVIAGVGLVLAGCLSNVPLFAQGGPASDLARRLGCFACHAAGPGAAAASLDGIGSRLSPEQLQVALTQPRRLHAGARMPSYAYLPDGERQALVDFLADLK